MWIDPVARTDNPADDSGPNYARKSITWSATPDDDSTEDSICIEFPEPGDNVQIMGVALAPADSLSSER
jgi:hypothetical protein